MESAGKALALLDELGYEDTVSGATCFINSATVFKAFGRAGDALPLFEKARKVYERLLDRKFCRTAENSMFKYMENTCIVFRDGLECCCEKLI